MAGTFANLVYFNDIPDTPPGVDLTWEEWLCEYVGLRRNLRLISRDGKSLSPECKFVAKHRNDDFLRFLRHVWDEQGNGVIKSLEALDELKSLPIKFADGVSVPLSCCYMPLEELQIVCRRFAAPELIPFLHLESPDDPQWAFLSRDLGVRRDDDLDFRLSLLWAITGTPAESFTTETVLATLDLYGYIESACVEAEDPQGMRDRVL